MKKVLGFIVDYALFYILWMLWVFVVSIGVIASMYAGESVFMVGTMLAAIAASLVYMGIIICVVLGLD